MINISKIKKIILSYYLNLGGWKTDRKIVVIESDDWGSIRMPSKETFLSLQKLGIPVENCHYNRYDSLATEEDLLAMFEVLLRYKDCKGNNPVITANCVVANPDFDKIKESNYKEYHYELFTNTLKKYPGCENSFNLWMKGFQKGIFIPQFHGREHLNVNRWINALNSGSEETQQSFDRKMFGISTNISREKRKSYMAAFDMDDIGELETQKEIISDGLRIFKQLFGFNSKSFIAPNYVWHRSLEKTLADNGVKYMQGAGYQREPDGRKLNVVHHRFGDVNAYGQIYLNRTCSFEPASSTGSVVAKTINEIEKAFARRKPAVITSHRVNYIGTIVKENRINGLEQLDELLCAILKRWPDVEFMSTDNLGDLIRKK